MGEALRHDTLREPVWDEHAAIAQAIGKGDVARAESLMRDHSGQAGNYLRQQLASVTDTADNSVVR
jgi:DNA-binding GntR family transcriptional regulator